MWSTFVHFSWPQWICSHGPQIGRFDYDHSAMWNFVGPVHSIWKYVIHVFEGDRTLQGLCGFSDDHFVEIRGFFIAHFALPHLPAKLMARFMKEYSDIVYANKQLPNLHAQSEI